MGLLLVLQRAPAYSIQREGNELTLVSDSKNYSFTYHSLPQTSIEGYVLSYAKSAGIKEGGVRAQLHYLSPADYQEYKAIRGCKAGFLNSHAKILFLIPDKTSLAETVSSLSLQHGSSFMLSGSPLAFYEAEVNGQEARIPVDARIQYFLPMHMNLNNKPLF